MKRIEDYLIIEGSSDMKLWDKIDELKEELGADKLLDEICQGLSDDALEKVLKFICKNYDIHW